MAQEGLTIQSFLTINALCQVIRVVIWIGETDYHNDSIDNYQNYTTAGHLPLGHITSNPYMRNDNIIKLMYENN